MDLYAENILDHYRHPRHAGALEEPTVTHQAENKSCGDDITLDLRIEDDVLVDIRWRGNGCALSQAGMSLLAEACIGQPIKDVEHIDAEMMKGLLGVPVGLRRLDCALLGLRALQGALGGGR